jgi:biofilm PGA synthesis N-glycosyltransferase PgaC
MKNSKGKALISVIIPTRNEEVALDKLLKSLSRQTYKNYEVVVVDGGSVDDTKKVAEKHGARFVRETGKYKSPANARNLGVKEAKGGIIAVFDCDSEVNERFLEEGVRSFKSDRIMGATCSYTHAEDTPVEKILASKFRTHKLKPGTPAFMRKGFADSFGGWDAALGYGEDRVVSRKIAEYNRNDDFKAIGHAKGAIIRSHLPHTIGELFGQQRWYGRTIMHFLKKYGNFYECMTLLKVVYAFVPFAVLMALLQTAFWVPGLAVAMPFILMSLYRTLGALAHGKIWGLGILFLDIAMGLFFAYGLSEYFFRSERGRD